MHNIRTNFTKILEVIKDIIGDEINEKSNYLRRGTRPKFSDIEVISLSLTAECLSILPLLGVSFYHPNTSYYSASIYVKAVI
jgi:hypothetical protein